MPVTTPVPNPPDPDSAWFMSVGENGDIKPTPAMQQFMVKLLALIKEMRDAIP